MREQPTFAKIEPYLLSEKVLIKLQELAVTDATY